SQQRRRERQRQAGRQPVGERLAQDGELKRNRAQKHQFKRPLFVVGLQDAVGRKQDRQQENRPQRAGRKLREQGLVRADAQGQKHDDDEVVADRAPDAAALPPGDRQFAGQERAKRLHGAAPGGPRSSRR